RYSISVALVSGLQCRRHLNARWFAILTFCINCNLSWAILGTPIIRRTPIRN
ncbi:hypothetical protein HAX54_018661, partial [Datura stramonium]|nr:hypothetical protein [Datura stramonium]